MHTGPAGVADSPGYLLVQQYEHLFADLTRTGVRVLLPLRHRTLPYGGSWPTVARPPYGRGDGAYK